MKDILLKFAEKHLDPFVNQIWDSVFFWRSIVLILAMIIFISILARRFILKYIFRPKVFFEIPHITIRIVPKSQRNSCWWHMGSSGDKPAMQISAKFFVTNITKYNILLTSARMKKPVALGHVMVRDPESQYHGSYSIPPGVTTDLDVDFWIMPPFKKEKESFIADIAIIDQFGNLHWLKKIDFKYT